MKATDTFLEDALNDGLASAMLEGYAPTPDFKQDIKEIAEGVIGFDQARQNALMRAKALDN